MTELNIGLTGDQVRLYQLYVIESKFKNKDITFKHYINMTLDLMEKYGATHEIVALMFSHIQANKNKKLAKELLSKNNFSEVLNSMLETNIFDENGKILIDLTTEFWQSYSTFRGWK
jgi:undecaprenyl pyrophosphate synthase